MTDRPLFRNGKVTTKIRTNHDGSILLFKPFLIKEEHLMKLTGAPGWDKAHVDEVFGAGVKGGLRYTFDIVQYDIDIATFREHAFVKDMGSFGEQYHVHQQYYKTTGLRTVNPKRREEVDEPPRLPPRLEFGTWLPCDRCKAKGRAKGERCDKCQGLGFLKWSSSSETSSSSAKSG